MTEDEFALHCPACGADNWRCWDERSVMWFDDVTGESAGIQVRGFLTCQNCGADWIHSDPADSEFIGAHEG